jgi:hypothetical protein
LHRPDGADELLLAALPTLKRGANDRCASGAIEIGTGLFNERDSYDYPGGKLDAAIWIAAT